MKVMHVIDSGGLYGAEVMLLNLMAEQAALGMEPMLASIGDSGVDEKPLEREARRRGLNVKPFRMRPGPNLIGAGNVLGLARREQVDLIHSHGYKGNILFGLLPKAIRKVPVIATLHGWTWTGGINRMMAYEWLESISLRTIDRVVLVNAAMKKHPRIEGRVHVEVVANGIPFCTTEDEELQPRLDDEVLAFCRRGVTVGAIGRLSREKGLSLLVDALSLLVREGRDLRLVIIGEGGERPALERQVKELRLEDRVLLPGYLGNAKAYLPLFTAFTMSSYTEGLPIVLLEAMQAGIPVVATAVGGIPDALHNGKAGIMVPPASAPGLATAIAAVLDDPASAAEMVKNGKDVLSRSYSSSAMAAAYRDIYLDVLASVPAASARIPLERKDPISCCTGKEYGPTLQCEGSAPVTEKK